MGERVAVITGAGNGIGAASALRLGKEGYRIWAADLDIDRAGEVVRQVEEVGGTGQALALDVTETSSVRRSFASVFQQEGRIDALVNSAGIVSVQGFEDIPVSVWERVLRVNLIGTYLCIQAAMPGLRSAPGPSRVVNIASGAAKVPGPYTAAYNASKAGVVSLTRSAAAWLAPAVSVNCICPGVIDTRMWEQLDIELQRAGAGPAARFTERVAALPIRRAGTAAEVAEVVWFLVGCGSSYIVGEDVNVSGGYVMH